MSIEQFKLILYDMYQMDAQNPPLSFKWSEEFKSASYSQWAINELEEFVSNGLGFKQEGPIDAFIKLTREFNRKMERYSRVNRDTRTIFYSAAIVSNDILDLLQNMK